MIQIIKGLVIIKSTIEPGISQNCLIIMQILKIIHNPEFLSTKQIKMIIITKSHYNEQTNSINNDDLKLCFCFFINSIRRK